MNSYNAIGRLTADPEFRDVGKHRKGRFAIAIQHTKDKASFIDCECWRRTAEIAERFLKKGMKFGFSGELEQQRWEKNGQKHSRIVFKVFSITFFEPLQQPSQGNPAPQAGSSHSDAYGGSQGSGTNNTDFDDDVPW